MDTIIHRKVSLKCNKEQSFEMFTKNENVQTWLAELADIELFVGGKYELFWDTHNKSINSTIGCKVTAIEINTLLCFEWKGPIQFAHFMNSANPLTHVTILFISDVENSTTDIHLIHTGWGYDEEWKQAQLWFDTVWTKAFSNLKNLVNT